MADYNNNHLLVADSSAPTSSSSTNQANRNLIRGNSVATLNQIYQHHNSIPVRNRLLNTAKSLQHPSLDVPDVVGGLLMPMEQTTTQQQHLSIQSAYYHQTSSNNNNQPTDASSSLNTYNDNLQQVQQQTTNNSSAWSRISALPTLANQTLSNHFQHQSIGACSNNISNNNNNSKTVPVIPSHTMPIQIINVARRHKKQQQASAGSSYNSLVNCIVGAGDSGANNINTDNLPYASYANHPAESVNMRTADQFEPRRVRSATKLEATGSLNRAWSSDSSSCSSSCGANPLGAGRDIISPIHNSNNKIKKSINSTSANPLNYNSRLHANRSPILSRNSTLDVQAHQHQQQTGSSRCPSPSRQTLPLTILTNQLSAETSPTHQQASSPRRRILPSQPQQPNQFNSSTNENNSSPNHQQQLYSTAAAAQQQVINNVSMFSNGSEIVEGAPVSNTTSNLVRINSGKKYRKLPQIPTELIAQQKQQMAAKLQQELRNDCWNGQQQDSSKQQQQQQRRAPINKSNKSSLSSSSSDANSSNSSSAANHQQKSTHTKPPMRALTTAKSIHQHQIPGEQLRVQSFPMPSSSVTSSQASNGLNKVANSEPQHQQHLHTNNNNNTNILLKHNLINNKFQHSSESNSCDTPSPRSPITMTALQRASSNSYHQPSPTSKANPKLTTGATASSSSSSNSPAAINSAGLIGKSHNKQQQQIDSSASTSGYFTFDQTMLNNAHEFNGALDNNSGTNFICYSPGGTRRITEAGNATLTHSIDKAIDNNCSSSNQSNSNQLQADFCPDSSNNNDNNSNSVGNYSAVRGRRLSTCGSGLRANFLMNKQHAISEFTPPRSLESSISRGSSDLPNVQPVSINQPTNQNNNANRPPTPIVHSSVEMLRASSAGGGASNATIHATAGQSSCQQLNVNTASAASLVLSSDSINSPAGFSANCPAASSYLDNGQNQYRSNSAQNIVMRNNSNNSNQQKSLSNRLTPVTNNNNTNNSAQQQQQHPQRQRQTMIMKMGGSTGGVIGSANLQQQQQPGIGYGYGSSGAALGAGQQRAGFGTRPGGYGPGGLPPRAASATESSSLQNNIIMPFMIGINGARDNNDQQNIVLSDQSGLGGQEQYLNDAPGCLINQTNSQSMIAVQSNSYNSNNNSGTTNMNFAGTGNAPPLNNSCYNERNYNETTNNNLMLQQQQSSNNAIEFQQQMNAQFPPAQTQLQADNSSMQTNNVASDFRCDRNITCADNNHVLGNRRLPIPSGISIDVYHCDEKGNFNNHDSSFVDQNHQKVAPMIPMASSPATSLSFELADHNQTTNSRRNLAIQQQDRTTSLVPPQQRDRQPSNVSTNSMPAVSSYNNQSIMGTISPASSGHIPAASGSGSVAHYTTSGQFGTGPAVPDACQSSAEQQQQQQRTAATARKFGAWAERIATSGREPQAFGNWPSKSAIQLAGLGASVAAATSAGGSSKKHASKSISTSSSDSSSPSGSYFESRLDDSSQSEKQQELFRSTRRIVTHHNHSRGFNRNYAGSPSTKQKCDTNQISELAGKQHHLSSGGSNSLSSASSSGSISSYSISSDSNYYRFDHNHHRNHHVGTSAGPGSGAKQTTSNKGKSSRVIHVRRKKKRNKNNRRRRSRNVTLTSRQQQQSSNSTITTTTKQSVLNDTRNNDGYKSSDQLTLCDKLKLAERSANKLFRKVELSPQQHQHHQDFTRNKLSSNTNCLKTTTELKGQEQEKKSSFLSEDNNNKNRWHKQRALAKCSKSFLANHLEQQQKQQQQRASLGSLTTGIELENGQEECCFDRSVGENKENKEAGDKLIEREADDLSLLLSSAERQLEMEKANYSPTTLLMATNSGKKIKQASNDSKGAIEVNVKKSWLNRAGMNSNSNSNSNRQGLELKQQADFVVGCGEGKLTEDQQEYQQHTCNVVGGGQHHTSVRKTATSAARVFRRAITLKSFVRSFSGRANSAGEHLRSRTVNNKRTETLGYHHNDDSNTNDEGPVMLANHFTNDASGQQLDSRGNKFPQHLLSVAAAELDLSSRRARLSADCLQTFGTTTNDGDNNCNKNNLRQQQFKQHRPSSAIELGGGGGSALVGPGRVRATNSQQDEDTLIDNRGFFAASSSRAALKLKAATFFSKARSKKQEKSELFDNNNSTSFKHNNNNNISSLEKNSKQHYYSRSVSRSSCPNADEKLKSHYSLGNSNAAIHLAADSSRPLIGNSSTSTSTTPISPRLASFALNAASSLERSGGAPLEQQQSGRAGKQHGLNRMKSGKCPTLVIKANTVAIFRMFDFLCKSLPFISNIQSYYLTLQVSASSPSPSPSIQCNKTKELVTGHINTLLSSLAKY